MFLSARIMGYSSKHCTLYGRYPLLPVQPLYRADRSDTRDRDSATYGSLRSMPRPAGRAADVSAGFAPLHHAGSYQYIRCDEPKG